MISATKGGQWTQARRAKNLCQLCKAEAGTNVHRFRCSAIVPDGGWPQPPNEAALALSRMTDDQTAILKSRGLLVQNVMRPARSPEGWFTWKIDPAAGRALEECRCYIDGSLSNGR